MTPLVRGGPSSNPVATEAAGRVLVPPLVVTGAAGPHGHPHTAAWPLGKADPSDLHLR